MTVSTGSGFNRQQQLCWRSAYDSFFSFTYLVDNPNEYSIFYTWPRVSLHALDPLRSLSLSNRIEHQSTSPRTSKILLLPPQD